MLYAPRLQDGSEAFDATEKAGQGEHLEDRVEKLNAAIADVRKQLEDLGART